MNIDLVCKKDCRHIKELEKQNGEMIECLKRCDKDMPRINELLASMGFHPFSLMEKDIKNIIEKYSEKK